MTEQLSGYENKTPGAQMADDHLGTPNTLEKLLRPDPASHFVMNFNNYVPELFSKLHHKKKEDRESSTRCAVEGAAPRSRTCITLQMKQRLCKKKIGRMFGKSPVLAALIFLNVFIYFILFAASSSQVCPIMFYLIASQLSNAGARNWLLPSWPLP